MYANTCWGLLGLAVAFGLAVVGLPTQYEWLSSWFLGAAVACGVGSIICFGWPLRQKDNRVKVALLITHPVRMLKLIEPSHIIIFGLAIAVAGTVWQWRRGSVTDPRIVQLESQVAALKKQPTVAGTASNKIAALPQSNSNAAPPNEKVPVAALASNSTPQPPSSRFKPQYEPEEISQMLTALRHMRGVIEKMPTFEEQEAVRWAWSNNLKAGRIAEMGQKIKDIGDRTLAGMNALDRLIQIDNKHFSEELQPVAFLLGDLDVIGAFSSTSSQLSSDLNELSRAQNLDVEKWTRTHFNEWQSSGTKYGDWVNRSNSRITTMTKDLREWKNP